MNAEPTCAFPDVAHQRIDQKVDSRKKYQAQCCRMHSCKTWVVVEDEEEDVVAAAFPKQTLHHAGVLDESVLGERVRPV